MTEFTFPGDSNLPILEAGVCRIDGQPFMENNMTPNENGCKVSHSSAKQGSYSDDDVLNETITSSPGACADMLLLDSMLNHLAKSRKAPFKSQQQGDPDLDFLQKKEIAQEILTRNPAQFLAQFGDYLLEDHLDYFSGLSTRNECYELDFHIKRLRRYYCKAKNQIDVKNRRFEALKKLIEEGTYFSEEEMMKRNPLLYEQLIGQYLTPKERENKLKERWESHSASYVVHLMDKIEQHYVNCLKKQQQDDEAEEMETCGEDVGKGRELTYEESDINEKESFVPMNDCSTDEEIDSDDTEGSEQIPKDIPLLVSSGNKVLTSQERKLLHEEFISNMYHSFLEGQDVDFDYSKVDSNPDFECLAVRAQDEEDKYFDSETPEELQSARVSDDNEEDEDELDKFMKTLIPDCTQTNEQNLVDQIL